MIFILSLAMGTLVGFFLGFFGSGGSVLAVPILIYVLGMPPKEAIASSLVIVGITAISGSIQKMRLKHVCYKVALVFGFFGILGAFTGAKLSVYLSGSQQLLLFSLLMLASAGSMLFKKEKVSQNQNDSCEMSLILAGALGLAVGILTGLVGVGGGFLIVPALSTLGNLNIRMAMGTSLFIISLNALSGILGYIGVVEFNFKILISFVVASSLASLVGAKLSTKVDPSKMKKAFSAFILIVGIFLFVKNMKGL